MIRLYAALLSLFVVAPPLLKVALPIASITALIIAFLGLAYFEWEKARKLQINKKVEERLEELERRIQQMGALDNYRKIGR